MFSCFNVLKFSKNISYCCVQKGTSALTENIKIYLMRPKSICTTMLAIVIVPPDALSSHDHPSQDSELCYVRLSYNITYHYLPTQQNSILPMIASHDRS